MISLLTRFSWVAVLVAALSLSSWSLFAVATHWGCPPLIAGLVSTCFDGAALVSAQIALAYARSRDSGSAARLAVFAFAAVSCYLNAQHAFIDHDKGPAWLLFAAPSAVSITVFELHTRYERRAALRAAGRVAAPLPVMSKISWVLFPVRSLRTLRAIVAHRLARIEADAIGREQAPALSREDTRKIRAWAREEGLKVLATGPVPQEILAAYTAALASRNGHPRAALTRRAGS